MLQSPENFHLSRNLFTRGLEKLTRGKSSYLVEKIRIWRNKPKGHVPEFYVDWSAKKFDRVALVNALIQRVVTPNEPKYLEIGCAGNKLFSNVDAKYKVGVDPFAGGTHRMTSDEFFELNNEKFDFVFVDGLHEHDQVRRDVENALRCLNPGGYIALHDMLPRNWIEAHVPCIRQGSWTGDAWKISFELAKTDGLEYCIVNIDHGVGVIKKTKKDVSLYKIHELQKEEYNYYSDNRKHLRIVEYEEFITA